MKETRADTAQAFVLALLLHLALFAVLFIGLWWTRSAAPAASGAMSAELMDASQLSTAMRNTLSKRPEPVKEVEPEPLPEPLPEPVQEPQPKPQDFIPLPDDVDQTEVTDQPTPTPAVEQQVQEAKTRQAQVDLTEQERQQEAQRRLTVMEQERLKQLEDIRRRRAAAAREADLAEQRLQQLARNSANNAAEAAAQADAQASGAGGTDDGLKAKYAEALRRAILAKWTRPDSVPLGAVCRLRIRQLPGGTVMSAEVSSPCDYDEQGRRSIEAAVLKAQPLPYAGFEPVFERDLTLNFRAEGR